MRFPVVLFLIIVCSYSLYGQNVTVQGENIQSSSVNDYGGFDHLNKAQQQVVIQVLQAYPELQLAHLEWRKKSIKTTMACRPTGDALWKNRKNRTYLITLNKRCQKTHCILPDSLDTISLEGILGHEMAHIVAYRNQSTLAILITAIRYSNAKYKMRMEHKTDSIAIEHGFARSMYHFANYLQNSPSASEAYKKMKQRIYLSPEQILDYDSKIRKGKE